MVQVINKFQSDLYKWENKGEKTTNNLRRENWVLKKLGGKEISKIKEQVNYTIHTFKLKQDEN